MLSGEQNIAITQLTHLNKMCTVWNMLKFQHYGWFLVLIANWEAIDSEYLLVKERLIDFDDVDTGRFYLPSNGMAHN